MHSDKQLIKKVKKNGDRKAADELVSKYYREIYAFTYRQTTDIELSKDLTQEIFIAVLKGMHVYDEKKSAFRTWIYNIASNKITDYYRSKYHKQQCLTVCISDTEEQLGSYETENSLIQKIYDEQLIQKVMSVIVEYGNEWVTIFQMKLFLDRTFGEIAVTLHLSENTIKTRYYTMLKRLRKEI